MAETPDTPIGTVTDGRVEPKGPLPKRALIWGLFIVAAVIAGINVAANIRFHRADLAAPLFKAADTPPASPDRGELERADAAARDAAERERAKKMAATPPPIVEPAVTKRQSGTGTGAVEPRRVRDADTMVISRRPVEATAPSGSGPSAMPTRGESMPPAMDASLDDIVAKVMRARGVTAAPALPGVPPDTPAPTTGTERKPELRHTAAISDAGPLHLLLESRSLDATLKDKLEGTNQSPVKALIAGPIYSHNREFVLIPDGTFAVGTANAVQSYGQNSLAVSFHRLEFPDGSTWPLDQFHGLNMGGEMGLRDRVNNHYVATFGRAAAVGVLQGLGQAVSYRGFGNSGNNSPVIIAGGVETSTSSAFNTMLNKMPLPSVEIRAGHPLKIYLTSDLELPAWSRTGEQRLVQGGFR